MVSVLAAGLDSVYVSVRAELRPGLLMVLRSVQEDAIQSHQRAVVVDLRHDGGAFLLRPYGWRGWPVRMDSPRYTVCLGAADPFPAIYIMVRSAFLHTVGAEEALSITDELVTRDLCGGPAELRVSRADVYADEQGWEPRPSDLGRFVTRAVWRRMFEEPDHDDVPAAPRRAHASGRRFSGFTFGKGAVVARIYDKTLEMAQTGDTWPDVLWPHHDPERPVWRVEFQFRREAVHQFGIRTVPDLLAGRQDLWEYGTRWLSLRRSSRHVAPSRWPEARAWQAMRQAQMGSPCSGLVRQRITQRNIVRLVQGFVGYATSLAATGSVADVQAVIDRVPPARRYVIERGVDLAGIVDRKRDVWQTVSGAGVRG